MSAVLVSAVRVPRGAGAGRAGTRCPGVHCAGRSRTSWTANRVSRGAGTGRAEVCRPGVRCAAVRLPVEPLLAELVLVELVFAGTPGWCWPIGSTNDWDTGWGILCPL